MQCLLLTGNLTTPAAVYLPYNRSPVPFGEPIVASCSLGTPAIFASPIVIASGSAVSFSIAGTSGFLSSLAGLTSIQAQLNTVYYVVGTSVATTGGAVEPYFYQFNISTTVGGVAPATLQASITSLAQKGGQLFVHTLSSQQDGPNLPFAANNSVLAMHGCNTGVTSITLMGAPDQNTTLATGVYGAPLGAAPGTWQVIATIGLGVPQIVNLSYDWITASGSTATLILLQN